jgi:hypothetical protein
MSHDDDEDRRYCDDWRLWDRRLRVGNIEEPRVSLFYVIDSGSTGSAQNCLSAIPPAPTPAVSPQPRDPRRIACAPPPRGAPRSAGTRRGRPGDCLSTLRPYSDAGCADLPLTLLGARAPVNIGETRVTVSRRVEDLGAALPKKKGLGLGFRV